MGDSAVLELTADTLYNTEILSSWEYVAIAYLDDTPESLALSAKWSRAAAIVEKVSQSIQFAKVDGKVQDFVDLLDVYGLRTPCVSILRNGGAFYHYNGGLDDPQTIARYVLQDAKPAVEILYSIRGVAMLGESEPRARCRIVGFFQEDDVRMDTHVVDGTENVDQGGAQSAYEQFQSTAEVLRGAAVFGVITDPRLTVFYMRYKETPGIPAVAMFSENGQPILWYEGPITQRSLMDWILDISVQTYTNVQMLPFELLDVTPGAEHFKSRFLASDQLKVIAFLRPAQARTGAGDLVAFQTAAADLQGYALFAYVSCSYAFHDLAVDLGVDTKWLPQIVAYHESQRFLMPWTASLQANKITAFVEGIYSGKVRPTPRSDEIPVGDAWTPGKVRTLVGKTFAVAVTDSERDVFVLAQKPGCAECRNLNPMLAVLARALKNEPRIGIATTDVLTNDLPVAPGYTVNLPALLWFPAKDYSMYAHKYEHTHEYMHEEIEPRMYWGDEAISFEDILGFFVEEGSFDPKTLRVPTWSEILTLRGEEVELREKMHREDLWSLRNELRYAYVNKYVDWGAGEVVFDGTRAHICVFFCLCMAVLYMSVYILCMKRSVRCARCACGEEKED